MAISWFICASMGFRSKASSNSGSSSAAEGSSVSVSGVGPKAALSILSATTPANLALSIITGDEKALTCAPGIGKKIAQRVILELKDKLAKGQTISAKGESYGGSGVTVIPENKLSEASAALAVLGYSQGEINVALKGIDLDSLTLEQIIKAALKKMMKQFGGGKKGRGGMGGMFGGGKFPGMGGRFF